MKTRTTKNLIAGLSVVTGLLLMAGVAEAAWSTTGSGSAQAKAGTASTLTASAATATATLYPGITGDVVMTVANPNPFAVTITAVTGPSGGIAGSAAGCTASLSGVTFNNKTGLSLAVPANATAASVTVTGAVTMSSASDNSCQGNTFTAAVTLAAQSA